MAKEGIGTVQMTLGETRYNYTTNLAGPALTMNYTSDTTHDYSVARDNYFTKTLPMIHAAPITLSSCKDVYPAVPSTPSS